MFKSLKSYDDINIQRPYTASLIRSQGIFGPGINEFLF